MRTIRFKGKRLDNQEWVYGGVSIFENEATIFDENDITNTAYEVDIDTISQFVGIKDIKEVDLYENDAVYDLSNKKFTIQYNDEFCAFFLYPIESPENFMAIYPGIILRKID